MKHSFFTLLLACFTQAVFASMQPVNSVFNLDFGANYYEVEFRLPKYELVTTETKDCGVYTSIVFPNDSTHSMLDNPGLPILPIYNLMLELPLDAHNIRVTILTADSQIVSIRYPIQPAFIEHYNEKTGELLEIDCNDEVYYEKGFGWKDQSNWYNYLCNTYDSITAQFYLQHIVSDTVRYRGAFGLSLTIVPMIYALSDSELNVLDYAHIIVKFDTKSSLDEMISQHIKDNRLRDQDVEHFYDTYAIVETPETTDDKGTFLIFVPQRVYNNSQSKDSLIAFESHKTSLGYNVIRYVYGSGFLANDVKNVIKGIGPDYILLCGSKSDIPEASIEDGIYSDRGYAIDDAAIGRWIISSNESDAAKDFMTIVAKTIKAERSYSNVGTAALFSGTDNRSYMRWEFDRGVNYVENKFSGTAIATVKTIGSNANSDFTKMKSILTEHCPMIFMYNGHGSAYGIGSPYGLNTNNISLIENKDNKYLPMSFGFACLLNNYSVTGCFGEKWLTEDCGGVTMYGSTTITYNTPDFYLTKRIFDCFRDDIDDKEVILMGRLVYDASQKYYDMCKTCVRRKQYRRYNYFGDPTISVFGIEDNKKDLRPALLSRKNAENTDEIKEEVVSYNVYTIMGNRLASFTQYEALHSFIQTYNGIALVQVLHGDNSVEVIKLTK